MAHCQLVLMSLRPLEEIGFGGARRRRSVFRFEKGEGKVIINETEYMRYGDTAIVPAGATHNVINTSQTDALKLYTIYAPSSRQYYQDH